MTGGTGGISVFLQPTQCNVHIWKSLRVPSTFNSTARNLRSFHNLACDVTDLYNNNNNNNNIIIIINLEDLFVLTTYRTCKF